MSASAVPAAAVNAARDAAKAWLRLDGSSEDALLGRLSASAIALGEGFLGSALIARGFVDTLAASGGWQPLAALPVTAIGAVAALAGDGSATPIAVGGYAVDIDAEGRGWVRLTVPGGATRVTVGYTAGLAATWDALPEAVAQGVVTLTAHLFDDREAGSAPPAAVAALWRPYRRVRLAAATYQGCGS